MCGIVGIVRTKIHIEDDAYIQAGVHALRHRGPDAQHVVRAGPAVFGVARLAIEGGMVGTQPMVGPRDGMLFAYNGERYSERYLESDTLEVLNDIIHYGVKSLQLTHSMYALALWDPTHNKKTYGLTLARDLFGQKPLYIANLMDGGIAFASLPKALRQIPGIDWSIDHSALHAMLRHGFIPGTQTGWRGIRKMRPGEVIRWVNGRIYTESRVLPNELGNSSQAPNNVREILVDAVRRCIPSTAPAGVLLSGGIDSGLVATLAHTDLRGAWTLRWQLDGWDESSRAALLAKQLGLRHHLVDCHFEDLPRLLDELVDSVDEPMADESILPTSLVCEAAAADVRVVLGGDGADELFGGYSRYCWGGEISTYMDIFSATPLVTYKRLLPNDKIPDSWMYEQLKHVTDMSQLQQRRWIDLHGYLPDQVLTKIDRASMRIGLEARAPLLSPEIAAWGLGLTDEQLGGALTKMPLRKAIEGILPDTTRQQPKLGFGVPTKHWFAGPLHTWVRDRLLGGALRELDGLDTAHVEQLLAEHESGVSHHERPIFCLLWLDAWLRREISLR